MTLGTPPQEDKLIWPDLPTVSVIVLNYNTCEHLESCFNSLQQLIYPEDKLELILVDNASTDQSVAYIRANFTDVKLIINDKNYGFSQGNNIGARAANGDLVAFLNPDMRVDGRWLIELVKPLLRDGEVTSAGSRILSWDGHSIDFAGSAANFYGYGYQLGVGQQAEKRSYAPEQTLFACGGAMIIRRQVFLDVGGFDEDFFAYYEDLDLGWRLWVMGYKVVFAAASITYHRHHGSWQKVNDEKRRVLYERNAFLAMLKNYDKANLNKILPVALLLLLKRIYLATGVDDDLFRLATTASVSLETQTETGSPTFGPDYYLGEAWRTLSNEGVNALYLKLKSELKRRRLVRQKTQKPGQMQLDEQLPDQAIIPFQALSYVVAGNDIISLYEKMLAKRGFIQARRRRSDEEILGLFVRPLGYSELWPEYQQTQNHLSRLFGIEQIFAV
jgi:GT2 family glycosyltransferase